MKVEITTKDGRSTTQEVEGETAKEAIRNAVNSPLAPENIREIKTLRKVE